MKIVILHFIIIMKSEIWIISHCFGLSDETWMVCVVSLAHYNDIIMSAMASRITSLTTVFSIVYSGADQRKHQSSASLAFVWGIHRWPLNSPHKGPVTLKMFPFNDIITLRSFEILHSLRTVQVRTAVGLKNGRNSYWSREPRMYCSEASPIYSVNHKRLMPIWDNGSQPHDCPTDTGLELCSSLKCCEISN